MDRHVGIALATIVAGGCGGSAPSPGPPAAGAPAPGPGLAAPADPCEALAAAWCVLQEVEGARCEALAARAAERGAEYCEVRLPDARTQIETARVLLAEEVPQGVEVPARALCPASEWVTVPAEPDPEGGEFTLEEALAGLPGEGNPRARIATRVGTLDCELFADRAPRTVANFVGLARGLRPYWDPCAKQWVRGPFYDGLVFHRVIPGFMIQGGDILGSGEGDGGYSLADEFDETLRHDRPGVMSMANSGPDTNGTQFFVAEGPTRWLDGKHSVFGLCSHAGVVARTARLPRDEGDRPAAPVVMRVDISR